MAEILICRPLCELDALTTKQCMTKKAYLQQDGMFMKLSMARTISQHVWINYNKLGKNALQLQLQNILREHLQNMHGSLCSIKFTWQQNYSRLGLRENTKSLKSETLRSLVCMLVLVTTEITKIHGIHPCKDGMAYIKTHVEHILIRCTD